jgi:hypothetical protein
MGIKRIKVRAISASLGMENLQITTINGLVCDQIRCFGQENIPKSESSNTAILIGG